MLVYSSATLLLSLLVVSLVFTLALCLLYQRRVGVLAQKNRALEQRVDDMNVNEERFTFALEGSGDGLWDWDLAANRVNLSSRWKSMLGYTDEEIGSDISEWSSRLHPDDVTRVMADVQDNLAGKTESFAIEHRFCCKNGSYMWILDRGMVVKRDAKGNALRMVGTHTDITATKIATKVLEASLRDGAAMLNALNMHAIVSMADRAGNIIDVNEAFCAISGYNRAELIGSNHRIVNSGYHPPEFWKAMWKDIASGKPWRNQVRNRAKNGSYYWVDTFIAPFKDERGNIERYISIRTDITASKQQELDLLRARDQLEKATDVGQMGVWVWDLQTNRLDWNEQMHRIYGTPADVRDSGIYYEFWRNQIHPEDIGFTEAKLQGAIAGTETYEPIFRIQGSQGDVRYIQASGFVERNAQGNATRVMGINRDITEQYRTEEILRQAKQQADSASKAKSEFLANMSHELRTPMNAILGMLALLKRTELTPRQGDYANKTEGAARSLLGLLNDILDLSKAEADKMVLDPHPFILDDLLRNLSVIVSTNRGNKPVEIVFDIGSNVPRNMVGDEMRLQQVLLNLMSNAIKFTPQGEVVLGIELQQLSDEAATLKFSVRDTGIGIASENQARIFTGFIQAEASTTRRYGGTGLGVAISQRMISLMGGQLELTSQLGEGSCFFFTITLPLRGKEDTSAQQALNAEHHAHLPEIAVSDTWRVLIVDDNPVALTVLARIASNIGWLVETCTEGVQAIELITSRLKENKPYQAIFVDWDMPNMDGWQTSGQIRKLDIQHSMPLVIMITAHDREVLAQRSEADQKLIDSYIVKPITTSMLVDAIMDAKANRLVAAPGVTKSAQEQRLTGMSILLTEDNVNNQIIASELLEAEGAIVQIANNGQEALEKLKHHPLFDVVLMDLQMPVMDGITATGLIRRQLGLTQLPIIAMTANAMASDREECLRAGMNEHIGKPFELDELVHVLRKQLGWQNLKPVVAEKVSLIDETSLSHMALAGGVDWRVALGRLGGKQELYVRMLPMFLSSLSNTPEQLLASLAVADFMQAARQLHTLKGLAGTMGAMNLAAQAALAEKQLSGTISPQSAMLQIANINAVIGETLPSLQKLLETLQTTLVSSELSGSVTTDFLAIGSKLVTLQAQLQASDMAALGSFNELNDLCGGLYRRELTTLSGAINNLDFATAIPLTISLMEKINSAKDNA